MCEDCGCSEGNDRKYFKKDNNHPHHHDHAPHEHSHVHEDVAVHTHSHDDDLKHNHEHSHSRSIEIQQKVLAVNDEFAAKNREYFTQKGITVVNLISSPGSGKTMLLEKTLDMLNGKLKCAVIVGDQQTDNDAKRLEGKGAKVVQIETQSACHLNAKQIASVLPEIIEDDTEFLFIENVGNLVCPAAFDLGENFKIALLSVTEGEDKPVKYPVLFSDAQIVILSKTDLVPHLDWNMQKCRQYIRQIKPGVFIFELSVKSGDGLSDWINYLTGLVK